MDRSRVAVPIASPVPSSFAPKPDGTPHPAPLSSVTDLGIDPVALAVVAGALLIAAGVGLLYRRRSGHEASIVGGGTSNRGTTSESTGAATRDAGDDRDRIREILRAHGGRTRQTVIVEQTGWSKAKVSAVLAEMDDDGEVSKLRVGRENLVSLPGHEPDAVDSPLED